MKPGFNRRRRTIDRDVRPNAEFRNKYKTSRWAKVRRFVVARDLGLCRRCGQALEGRRMHVDHVIPAAERPDLFHDPTNLELLCDVCHAAKTRKGI